MNAQPEQLLENGLIDQLQSLGYESITLKDEADLVQNFKRQIEKHNKVELAEAEFNQIMLYINKGNIFERAKTLRSRIPYVNSLGENKTIQLLDSKNWCKNEFQVANQITMKGSYDNRYDVTILINGLPLVQVELKRRGLELKEAFNQINRYQRHSYTAGFGLFQFIQLFVISNGVNTKYYCNGSVRQRNFKQTFYWAKKDNSLTTNLSEFADDFMNPCHLSKMITQYIVLNETQKALMVLRPYQYYAVEEIINQVKTTKDYGYIWHTTGSGKTLTSFKAAQILTHIPEVHKVVFVVDRKDLDYQTAKEFNSFAKGSIYSTNNTNTLVEQLNSDNKLIVTTIQKLNNAITGNRYKNQMSGLQNERIVFIFDECHRSQFGMTHENIVNFFKSAQLFGFTGTPIFKENAGTNEYGKRTTKMLFGECLHKYVITDAIRDGNVLRFAIEYIRTFKQRDEIQDIEIEKIDEAEVMNSPIRRRNIVNHIIQNHPNKTHHKTYTSMFCVADVDAAIEYYQLFKTAKEEGKHNLNIATIFTYQANEEDKDAGTITEQFGEEELSLVAEDQETYATKHSREYLDEFILDYNQAFQTNYSTKDSKLFYEYYNDIAARVKTKQIDVLIVVNMFLTGFDSKTLNTLYVDKNLKYHGLIQAYSRTNRILDEVKSHGNIVCYRNLKDATDKAIELFANKDAIEDIIEPAFERLEETFQEKYDELIEIVPSVDAVNDLKNEEEQAEFIKAFRDVMRLINKMKQYADFSFDDLPLSHQEFEDFKSKYLDLYEETKGISKDEDKGHSVLDDLDFELELIHRDEINVTYIMNLIVKLQAAPSSEKDKQEKLIQDLLNSDLKLRSKKELIEKFIQKQLPFITDADQVLEEFDQFVYIERQNALKEMSKDEQLDPSKLEKVIGEYLFSDKQPLRDDIVGTMLQRPSLKERSSKIERVTHKIFDFVNTYVSGFVGR
ncbi:type I restriction endonuclease subunit R [Empedobacter falsenii]|uniref:Type I restriction enzyme endonuclease subunit n=1 Tax=Empedobacter falsenii TaxID=343874 RepID=A0AAW7DJ00_9FLAO|nr:type I restriction endonuclease subunit R [Empedobacter falsenii]MDM1551643.1 type I restriction endonuclease subunit R [Empedobacter falsenii]